MTPKIKIIIISVALLCSFAAGRYTVPTKTITVTKTVEVEKKTENKDSNKHYVVVKHETDKPDGTKEITTTKTETDTTQTKVTDNTNISQDQSKTVISGSQKVTLAALAGVQMPGTPNIVYGASVTKPVLGPITIGIFGLTNSTFGASVGVSF